ncbi:MAG TPA: Stealth CR1 domain-containing protein, partial [Ornithinicoccus sp.]|nr:Stealth CR1 domain-containing protein [Ornithinicoccus sp.]
MTSSIASAAPEQPTLRRLLPADLLALTDSSADLEITTHRARFVIALRQADVTRWRLAARTATAVADSLAGAGVPFFAMHLPYTRSARWGVRRDDLASAFDAMRRSLGEEGFYYHARETGLPRPVTEALTPDQLESLRDISVFQFVRCTTTDKLYGASDGCRIAVWDDHEGRATLVSPDRQSIVQEIDRSDRLPLTTRARWDGWMEPSVAGSAGDASAIEFPVDAVYLWVDDSDPRWRAKRAATRRRLGLADLPGASEALYFRDRGELRASMRSLEAHAPWIRHI